jgi:hypothetical protein
VAAATELSTPPDKPTTTLLMELIREYLTFIKMEDIC